MKTQTTVIKITTIVIFVDAKLNPIQWFVINVGMLLIPKLILVRAKDVENISDFSFASGLPFRL